MCWWSYCCNWHAYVSHSLGLDFDFFGSRKIYNSHCYWNSLQFACPVDSNSFGVKPYFLALLGLHSWQYICWVWLISSWLWRSLRDHKQVWWHISDLFHFEWTDFAMFAFCRLWIEISQTTWCEFDWAPSAKQSKFQVSHNEPLAEARAHETRYLSYFVRSDSIGVAERLRMEEAHSQTSICCIWYQMGFQSDQLWNRNQRKFHSRCLWGSSPDSFFDSNSVDNFGHPGCLHHHWWFSTNLSASFGDSEYIIDVSCRFGQRESISRFDHSTTTFIVEPSHELEPNAVAALPLPLAARCLAQGSDLTFDHCSGLKWFIDAGSGCLSVEAWHHFDVLCLAAPSTFFSPLSGDNFGYSCVMLFLWNATASFAGFACTHYWSDWIDSNLPSLLHRHRHPKHALHSLDPHTRNYPGHLEKWISCRRWLDYCCLHYCYWLFTNG